MAEMLGFSCPQVSTIRPEESAVLGAGMAEMLSFSLPPFTLRAADPERFWSERYPEARRTSSSGSFRIASVCSRNLIPKKPRKLPL